MGVHQLVEVAVDLALLDPRRADHRLAEGVGELLQPVDRLGRHMADDAGHRCAFEDDARLADCKIGGEIDLRDAVAAVRDVLDRLADGELFQRRTHVEARRLEFLFQVDLPQPLARAIHPETDRLRDLVGQGAAGHAALGFASLLHAGLITRLDRNVTSLLQAPTRCAT